MPLPGSAAHAPSLEAAISRLTEVLEEENAALSGRRAIVHAGLTERKNQLLRDMLAVQAGQAAGQAYGSELRRLKTLLARNAALLKTHIAALGEVTDVIVAGLRDAESDGTYSARGAFR